MLPFIIALSLVWMNIADEYEFIVGDEYNTGVDGQMFMVEATTTDVLIDSFTFRWNGGGSTEYTFEVWYKEGDFVDYRLDESYWTLACEGSAAFTYDGENYVWVGPNTGSCPISIPTGQRYSIYIAGISRGCVTEKICSGSSCTNTFEDVIASDAYLTAYLGLGLHDTFGNGYLDTYFVHPDVTIYYGVNALSVTTPSPTEAYCCEARGTAIWGEICGSVDKRRLCNMIYDEDGNKRCEYQLCDEDKEIFPFGAQVEEDMFLMNNIYGIIAGNKYHWMLYACLASAVAVLLIFMYRCCKGKKTTDGYITIVEKVGKNDV